MRWGLAGLLWLLALFASQAFAQNFDFKPPASVADPGTPAVMRDLAERILPVYAEDNPERYLSNLSMLQLVAGNYTAAYASRQSLRDRLRSAEAGKPVTRSLILDLYAHARAIEAASRGTFAQAFIQAYHDAIQKLNDLDATTAAGWLATPVATFQDPAQKIFDQVRPQGDIALPEAMALVEAYTTFDAYRNFAAGVTALNTEDEQRRYAVEDNIIIMTDKDVEIAASLVRPKTVGKTVPTLLEFTPYAAASSNRDVAAHGYVGMVAYVRARGKSTGTPLPYQKDGDDARAVIEWITQQSWSDGTVGMYGSSYSGFTPWAAAKKLPPALKAIAVTSPTAPGIDVPDDGAVTRNSSYRWSLYMTSVIDEKTYEDEAAWRAVDQKWYASGKAYREYGTFYGKPSPLFLRWLNHPSYDGFWQPLVPYGKEFAKVNIPVLTITGYFAAGEAGALYYFNEHHKAAAQADHTLLIGPYDDAVTQRGVQPVLRGYTVDPVAQVDLRELRFQWFDHVLKNAPQPQMLQSPVNFQFMGANEWRHAPSLEAMGNGSRKFYLDSAAVGASHHLAQKAPAKGARTPPKGHARARPSDPGYVDEMVDLADRKDADNWTPQSDIAGKSVDVRSATAYVSDPLQKPLDLQGGWSAHLDLTVNKMDVDLRIAAYELLPGGDYVQLFEPYTVRASYAKDRARRRLLKAGERQALVFKIERLTSRRLQAGSRLVLVLGINKRPDQEINLGADGDVSAASLEGEGNRAPVKVRWFSDSYVEMGVQQ